MVGRLVALLGLGSLVLTPPTDRLPEVKIYGALRLIINEGKTDEVVKFSAIGLNPQMVGLGALEKLDGEVTILDGKVHLVRPRNGKATRETTTEPTGGACLLAVATVPAWREIKISRDVKWDELDAQLESMFHAAGLDTEKRIPYRLDGSFRSLEAHVIDGTKLPNGPSSHEEHVSSGVLIKRASAKGTIVGFFSKYDKAVITHHSTTCHMHCLVDGGEVSGHVDHMVVKAGTVLRIPR